LRRLCRLIAWFLVADALITMFGLTTAPLLLSLAADGIVGWLLVRSCIEIRATLLAVPATTPLRSSRQLVGRAPAPRFADPNAGLQNGKGDC
jgi:hypothetical protein